MTGLLFVLHKRPDGVAGGTELHTLDLIRGLMGKGFRVHLLFPGGPGLVLRAYGEEAVEERAYDAGGMRPEDLENASLELAFGKILEDFSIDTVHFQHLYGLPISFIDVAKARGCRTIISVHDYFYWCYNYNLLDYDSGAVSFCYYERDDERCFRCLRRLGFKVSRTYNRERRRYIARLFKSVDAVVFPSDYARRVFLALYGELEGERCRVIEHGIRKGDVPPVPTPETADPHVLNNPGPFLSAHDRKARAERLNVGFLGNFTVEKGNYHFRRVADRLLEDGRFRFYVVGNVDSPFNHKRMKNVRFLGGYDRGSLGRVLKGHMIDVVTLLSPWPEVYSFTFSEAVYNGIPVLATDLGALRERMSRHMVGFLVPHQDPVPRTVRILEDLALDPEILEYFRNRCLEASRELPDVEGMTTRYVQLYRRVRR